MNWCWASHQAHNPALALYGHVVLDPVVTPHGVLYSREAILENLLAQKKAIKKRMAAWEAAQAAESKKVCAERAAVLLCCALIPVKCNMAVHEGQG
eukprot:scaffold53706_cov18-Tisochrysis_lutea.AAC.2